MSHRILPRGQFSMLLSEAFGGPVPEGWIEVTSPTAGLAGVLLSGNFSTTLDAVDSSVPLAVQNLPGLREDLTARSDIGVANPGSTAVTVTLQAYNGRGESIGATSRSLPPRGGVRLRASTFVSPDGARSTFSVRVTSTSPVAAAASVQIGDAAAFIPGQSVEFASRLRIIPHFATLDGRAPHLVLTNPSAANVVATVTLFGDTGGSPVATLARPIPITVAIPANGSTVLDVQQLTGLLIAPPVDGWVQVDAGTSPLNGVLFVEQGSNVYANPLEDGPADRALLSPISETESLSGSVVVLNPSVQPVRLEVSAIRADGSTAAQRSIDVPPATKLVRPVRDLFPELTSVVSGGLLLRSTGTFNAWLSMRSGTVLRTDISSLRPAGFVPDSPAAVPFLQRIEPAETRPGGQIRLTVQNIGLDMAVIIGSQVVNGRTPAPGIGVLIVDVPALEPGFVSVRLRNGGLETNTVSIRVVSNETAPGEVVDGRAFYQKYAVTDAGLNLTQGVMAPIRNARVEVIHRVTQAVWSVSETDARGWFRAVVPADLDASIRILSRSRSGDVRIVDNTSGNALYATGLETDLREARNNLILTDQSRGSGAFNILDIIQKSNVLLKMANAAITPPAINVFWSVRNSPAGAAKGAAGSTYFDAATGNAFVLGDRAVDSDEFDDSVIAHEYAHLLATRFSRDDSPGGPHLLGDMLDPRIAWSEGWANFFAGLVLGEASYRDSFGSSGSNVLRYDLEENVPAGDRPGYWSEASVQGLLWDLYDDRADAGDSMQVPFSAIWGAFTDLRADTFVYLPDFLDRFLTRNPSTSEGLRGLAQVRSIDFQFGVRPPVSNPFPTPVAPGQVVTGEVDSLSTKRSNLLQSAHFLMFQTTGGAVSIRLDVLGLGSGNDPRANDLDLFLMDASGRLLDRSDRGLNGQSELISTRLAEGTYVVEVRSYYTRADTNGTVYNSGRYRVTVGVQ